MKQRAAEAGRTLRVIGVQSSQAAAYPPSITAGKPTTIEVKPTIADGIAVARPGELPFQIIKDTVDEIVTVSDDDIARALLMLFERAKLIAEPAGAVGVAAILAGKIETSGPTTVILSGGNIDAKLMERVISRGLISSGRYLHIRIPLPDRPGQLARVSEIVADQNANVIEVLHTRHGVGLQISQVELSVDIETRGPEHSEQVLTALRDEGYEPRSDF
jgi:threonine dehydratase